MEAVFFCYFLYLFGLICPALPLSQTSTHFFFFFFAQTKMSALLTRGMFTVAYFNTTAIKQKKHGGPVDHANKEANAQHAYTTVWQPALVPVTPLAAAPSSIRAAKALTCAQAVCVSGKRKHTKCSSLIRGSIRDRGARFPQRHFLFPMHFDVIDSPVNTNSRLLIAINAPRRGWSS